MSDQNYLPTESSQGTGVQLDPVIPFVILCISFIVLLGWQVSNASSQRTIFENAITRQQPAVSQAQRLQDSVSKLATDLMTTAQTDDMAKQIVDKYKIQQQGTPTAPTDAAAPAASATP